MPKKAENSRNEIIINETEHPAVYSTVLAMKKKGL